MNFCDYAKSFDKALGGRLSAHLVVKLARLTRVGRPKDEEQMVATTTEPAEFTDPSPAIVGLQDNSAQALASRLADHFGDVLTNMFGQDPVCDFLINSIRDHIEECGVDLDYDAAELRTKLADVSNLCMKLHNVAGNITPHQSGQSVA